MSQIYCIYIFSRQRSKYEQWAKKEWPKVKGIFTEIDSVCVAVRQTAFECDDDNVVITSASSSSPSSTHIEPTFMYSLLFKEIVLELKFDNEKKEIKDLVDYVRNLKVYVDNEEELAIIDEFAREYQGNVDNKPIWWYTKECFTYHLLNKALAKLDVVTLLKMSIFMRDLHKNIEQLHQQQLHKNRDKSVTLFFRGKVMEKTEFESKIQPNGLISFNNFLSTTDDRRVALHFISEAFKKPTNKSKTGILFKMIIYSSVKSAPYASIAQYSYFMTENEVLFSTHTVFRVQEINEVEENDMKIQQVNLMLTSDKDDPQLSHLTQYLREEITGTGWHKMGRLLWKMGQNENAEQVFQMLLRQSSNTEDKVLCYNELAWIKQNQGEYKDALDFYERSLILCKNDLPPHHSELGHCYNGIGNVYYSVGEYIKALSFYEQALEIRKTALSQNHPSLATSYNNIGLVYHSIGQYSKALSSYEQALEIRKIVLPPNHPYLAISYKNMGMVYKNMGEYSKALLFHEQALEINQRVLPPNHPDLGRSYNNIGEVYVKLAEYTKAVSFSNQALNILQKALRSNHPDMAHPHNNMGLAYRHMGDHLKALSYHEKALDIRKTSLPPDHPDLAATYHDIGTVYYSMEQLSKALSFYEKALEIRQKSLPATHPDIVESQKSVADVKKRM